MGKCPRRSVRRKALKISVKRRRLSKKHSFSAFKGGERKAPIYKRGKSAAEGRKSRRGERRGRKQNNEEVGKEDLCRKKIK